MRRSVVAAGLLLGMLGPGVVRAQVALADYAVLGLEGVRLGSRARVRSGAVGTVTGALVMGAGARVAGTAAADTVVLRPEASAGRLFCRLVRRPGDPGGVPGPTVEGSPLPLCRAFTPPVVDATALPPVDVVPGTTPLHIRRRTGTGPMAAGSYGDVSLGAGALLQLAGGSYAVRSIRVARAARIVCVDACELGVQGGVDLRAEAQLGAASSVGADKVRVNVAGEGALAFSARRGAIVAATIYAPAGELRLGARGSYRGAFIGRAVRVGARAQVREDSALPAQPAARRLLRQPLAP